MRRAQDDAWRRFQTEAEARHFALKFLGEHFNVYEEVTAFGPPGRSCYTFDALTICPETDFVVAWEFKRSHLFKSEFANVLRQATYYRMAAIDDPRLVSRLGWRPHACMVFPDWDGLHDKGVVEYAREADGMRLLASHFRVGALTDAPKYGGMSMTIGESAVWHSWAGWTKNAEGVLRGKRPLGSVRRNDLQ